MMEKLKGEVMKKQVETINTQTIKDVLEETKLNDNEKKIGLFDRSIGSKLLENMGYNGKELGIFEQIILKPIQLEIRLKYMVFGYNVFNDKVENDLNDDVSSTWLF
jgi:uncharacterized membrane protein YvbJ